jgi:hypothetical protein
MLISAYCIELREIQAPTIFESLKSLQTRSEFLISKDVPKFLHHRFQ